jgi:hypothetical protein
MDVQRPSEAIRQQPDLGAERAAALADARRRLSAEGQQSAEAASARRSREIAQLRDVVASASGANTRVVISRAPTAPIFIYRAIDQTTGEIVQEWPKLEFLNLARSMQLPESSAPGSTINEKA